MIRILIIIGIIFLVILLIITAIRKKLEKIFSQFIPKQQTSQKEDSHVDEVLYEKGEVVVLRGEGKREKGEGKKEGLNDSRGEERKHRKSF